MKRILFILPNYLRLPIWLSLATLFIVCKQKWLAEKSDKRLAVPTTLKDFQALLDLYSTVNSDYISLREIASDGHYVSDAAFLAATSDNAVNAYTWSYSSPYQSSLSWSYSYSIIFYTNVVLDGLKNNIPANESDRINWSYIKGQALFHRASSFYSLAQIWTPPFNSNTAESDLSIPLKLESDVSLPSVRSSAQLTYNQILNDLFEAKELLPANALYKTRPSKAIVDALLSRIYLSMREYGKAEERANACLTERSELLDYNTLSLNANFIGNVNSNPEVLLYNRMITSSISSFLTTNCYVDRTLFELYDDNDLRKSVFYRVNPDNTISYKGNYDNSATDLFCGLATDEMYLIRAECYARAGKTAEAMKDLNDLLRTRWKKNPDGITTYVDQTAPNADAALGLILTERRKELILRGLRWTDLRRLNQEDRFKTTLTRTIGGQTYTLEPNSYKYTFPIPDDIIAISGMQQNPGWEK